MSQLTVSVLMTAYNRGRYIAEAIESVLNSSFADFELIIVDDGSSDATVDIARRYLSDVRVQLHINEHNLGDYPNRNKAAEYARGTYVKYVDSDDIIYPHGLAVMVDSMERFPDAGLGLSSLKADLFPYPLRLTPEEAYSQHFLGDGLFANAPLSAIIRRQAFWEVGGFSGLRYAGDNEMWLKIAMRNPVVKMVPGLTWWRSHGDQEVVKGNESLTYPKLVYELGMKVLNDIDCPLRSAERQAAIQRLKSFHARLIFSVALKSMRLRSAYDLFYESGLTWPELIRGGLRV